MTQFSKLRPGTTDEGLRERSAIYPKGGGKGIAFLEDTLIGGAPRAGAAATGTTGRPRQYELLSTNGLCVLLVRGNSRRWRRDSRGTRHFDRGDTASTYGNDGITRITRATHATAYQRHTRTLKILALGQTSTGVTPPRDPERTNLTLAAAERASTVSVRHCALRGAGVWARVRTTEDSAGTTATTRFCSPTPFSTFEEMTPKTVPAEMNTELPRRHREGTGLSGS